MGNTNYIAAIELSSSKISGTVGIETYDGIKILAAASMPVEGFISKGVVRNVDETSNAINCIINSLESSLDNVDIKKVYVSLSGLTIRSVKSKVTRNYDDYTKITPEIVNGMAEENDETFTAPEGYTRVQVVNQEYRLDGKIDNNPIGAPTMTIEGNYLNIIMKEQYLKQLNDSFAQAKIEIADSFNAARMDADIMLSKDARRNGCALVNIGAETTTIAIYNNDILRMQTVLPLGSRNITLDLCSEHISYDEAEEIKITRGYKPQGNENGPIDTELTNSIINARMSEILQNARYQIEESGEFVSHIVFTGGGSKLKNLDMLLQEFMPNFKTEIISEPNFNLISSSNVNINGVFSTALYGLLKQGKENCCEDHKTFVAPSPVENNIFADEVIEEIRNDDIMTQKAENDEKKRKQQAEEERKRKEIEDKKRKKAEQKKQNSPGLFDKIFNKIMTGTQDIIDNITEDEGEYNYDDER